MEQIEEIVEDMDQDILLSWKTASGKQGHFRTETVYFAAERRVVNRTTGTVRRFWGLLPPRQVNSKPESLPIPEDITTVDQLRAYVALHRRNWIYGRHRR